VHGRCTWLCGLFGYPQPPLWFGYAGVMQGRNLGNCPLTLSLVSVGTLHLHLQCASVVSRDAGHVLRSRCTLVSASAFGQQKPRLVLLSARHVGHTKCGLSALLPDKAAACWCILTMYPAGCSMPQQCLAPAEACCCVDIGVECFGVSDVDMRCRICHALAPARHAMLGYAMLC
jgi:hypothetical protein